MDHPKKALKAAAKERQQRRGGSFKSNQEVVIKERAKDCLDCKGRGRQGESNNSLLCRCVDGYE